jgi:ribosomal 50S subunit-recycling heat shock protein
MGVRIDQLLHWLCLEPSRSHAARACREQRVFVNGAASRASREVRAGDRIVLHDPLRGTRRELEVLALPEGQASRRDAGTLYRWCGPVPAPEGREPDGGGT